MPTPSQDEPQLYLASASPRRRELLQQVGLRFVVQTAEVDERPRPQEAPVPMTLRLALAKAHAIADRVTALGLPRRPVVGADTCVTVDRQILGKPRDDADARAMLRRLSGRVHEVITAVAVVHGERVHTAVSRSEVTFKTLSEREIGAYVQSGEPADKAGGYAIQGLGSGFVSALAGSFTGVVGLPMFELRTLLNNEDIDWL